MKNSIFKPVAIFSFSIWLVAFACLPFLLILMVSFLKSSTDQFFIFQATIEHYLRLLSSVYVIVFYRSLVLAAITAVFCLLFGYPFAYILAKLPQVFRTVLLLLMIIPFWTSSLIRVYAMIILIRNQGLINHFLLWLGVIDQPIQLLYTQAAVLVGLIYTLLPFMVLPIYVTLEKMDWNLLEAARDLGANRLQTLFRVVVPLSMPGIVAGFILVLLPSMTYFFIPVILGNAKSLLLGNLIESQFVEAHNWPLGSAASVILTLIMGLMIFLYWKISASRNQPKKLKVDL